MKNKLTETFEFNFKERGEKFWKILSREDDTNVQSEIVRRRWAAYLEQELLPCPWLALVKPSKVVDVIHVNPFNFWATVETVSKDEKAETEEYPLIKLFPLNDEQSKDSQKIKSSAEALDHFRFFVNHIWYPWDEDPDGDLGSDDEYDNWITDHLNLRLIAAEEYDNEPDSEAFIKLKKLGRDYKEAKDQLELVHNLLANLRNYGKVERISKMAAIVENPECFEEYKNHRRQLKEKHRQFDIDRGYSIDRQAVLVWPGGRYSGFEAFMTTAKSMIPFDDAHLVIKNSLQDAIDFSIPNDIIILSHGEYVLDDLGDLNTCLTIFGSGEASKTIINLNSGYGFEVIIKGRGSVCNLRNLTLKSKSGQGGIWIKDGAALEIKDCLLMNLYTAIKITGQDTVAKLKYSEVQTCHVGFEIDHEAQLDATGGLIEDCDIGILAEKNGSNERNPDEPRTGIVLEEMDNYAAVKIEMVDPKIKIRIDDVC